MSETPQGGRTAEETLANEQCHEVPPGTPALTAAEAANLASALSGDWQLRDGALQREFSFGSFNAAFGLATRVALLAESQQHHPEMEVGWGRLAIHLVTHSIGGLSRNDFIMAARIDALSDA